MKTSWISEWVHQWLTKTGRKNEKVVVEPLAGDGSTRCFYRIRVGPQTLALLSDPEWGLSKDYAPHQAHLESREIPVPRFLEVDASHGVIVMQDLGDELVQHRLASLSYGSPEWFSWLEKSIRLLAQLHGRTYPVDSLLPVASRRFDAKKYSDELAFTVEHLVEKFLGLPAPKKPMLDEFCAEIAKLGPDVFAHRDYHTRNLLVVGQDIYMIDFQDARLGGPHYDLASLLYDAYVTLDEEHRERLLAAYRDEMAQYPLSVAIDWARLREGVDHVGLQRTVKAAGSFASFYTRYGKKTHLPYLEPALRSALRLRENSYPDPDHPMHAALPIESWLETAARKLAVIE